MYCDRHSKKSFTSIYEACYLHEFFINIYEVLVPKVLIKLYSITGAIKEHFPATTLLLFLSVIWQVG